jgi:hypothetical protein
MDACGDVLGVSAPCRFMIVGAAGLPAAGEAVLASAGGDARSDLDSALAAPALLLTVAALRCERSARGGTGGVSIRISSAATFGPGAAGLVAEKLCACRGAPATKMASMSNLGAKPCGISTTESGARASRNAHRRASLR